MEKWILKFFLFPVLTAAVISFSPVPILADYPEKPVTILCGYAAGGANDMVSRAMAEALKKYFPKPMVVVNRPGAGATIAASELFRSKPDGYTIGIIANTVMNLQPYRVKLPYTSPEDFTPIIRIADNPNLLAVKSEAPWKTLQELIAHSRANPGKIRVGNSGIGTELHLIVEQLNIMAKSSFTSVPFSGSGESVPALLGGHVEALSTHPNNIVGHVSARKIRVLLVFEEKRNPLFPDAPSSLELGYDITMPVTYLFVGPKGLPSRIVTMLHDAFRKGLEDPIFHKPISSHGLIISYAGPLDAQKRLLKEYEANAKLVDILNLRAK